MFLQFEGLRAQHQVADAGTVHLDAEEVIVRVRLCERDQRFAIAEAYLERARGGAAKSRVEVERLIRLGEAVARPQFPPGTLLRDRHPSGPRDEAADRAPVRRGVRVGAGGGRRSGIVAVQGGRVRDRDISRRMIMCLQAPGSRQ